MAKVKILSNEKGKCPYCNCEDMWHIEDEFTSEFELSRTMQCKSCCRYFIQWFNVEFTSNCVGNDNYYDAKDFLNKEVEYEEEE